MSKRKRISPVEDATAHILSGEDKPCFEERFINSYKGRGVFASMSIDKGCFILEYRGELLCQEESQTRQNIYKDKKNTFLFDFNWIGRQWCIDASKEDGSLGRLVNDNHKTPNCKVKKIGIKGKPHLCLFSVKDIAPGEELTYNYGDSNWPWRTLVTRAVPCSEENTPSEEGSCLLTKINSPKPTEQVLSRFAARVKEHHDNYAQCYEQLSKLTLEAERGATDYSQNDGSEMSSISDYSDQEYVPDTDGSLSDNSFESKELNIWHAEPLKGHAFEFKSTTDTSTSSSYHSSTSVTPTATKNQRNRYKKKQYCAYCQKPYSKIARHLEFVHRSESEVAKAFSFDKRSKERRVRLRLLRSRGNFAHNAAVSKAGNGEMVACRRPKEVKSAYDFTHCIHCLGLYNRNTLWRHNRTCPQNLHNENRTIGQKRVQSLNNLTLPPPVDVSRSLWTIACEMVNDEVSNVVRNDRYILLLGEQMYNRLKSHSGRNNYIRQKMREVARLLITARKLTPIRKMENFIQPGNFHHVIKAVRVVAGFSEETNTYKTPSLALKLGHSLVKIANFVESNARMSGRYAAIESARNFRRLYESKWTEEVFAAALTPLGEAKWKKPRGLDGIMIDPQDELSSNSSSDEAESQTSSCRDQEYEDHVNADNLQDEGLKVSSEKKANQGSQKAHVGRAKSPSTEDLDNAHLKPGTKVSVKRKWSEEEVGAVEKHLMHFIRSCRVPGKTDCVSCLLAEPQALKNRDWSAVKFYINNRITALKRQQRH